MKEIVAGMEDRELQIRVEGNLLRVARLDAELYQFTSNPEALVERLRASGERIDIFTFQQGLPETAPRYPYHMEWDNLAVLKVSTFENWWNHQIRSTGRNRARQAEKKGIILREVPFDEDLVRGIWGIFNESPVRQGRRFRHYGKDMETVRRLVGTYLEYSTFIGAFRGEELIGFIKMVADQTGVQAGLMNILSKVQYKDTGADQRTACAGSKILCRSWNLVPRLRQLRLRKKTGRQPDQLQGTQWIRAREYTALLRSADTSRPGCVSYGFPAPVGGKIP